MTSDLLVKASRKLCRAVSQLHFAPPVSHIYNPLDYARAAHEAYLKKFGRSPKRVIFLGMNPGPFGMVQTGVPFGEVTAVRGWLGIRAVVPKPKVEHPRRPVTGFGCVRSEVSGRRLWGFFAERFGTAEIFFKDHFVVNYCPLAFLEAGGRNLTPDKLPAGEKDALFSACDRHLLETTQALQPEWVVGIGEFAAKRAEVVLQGGKIKIGRILHPSPASPAANRNWAVLAFRQLRDRAIWD